MSEGAARPVVALQAVTVRLGGRPVLVDVSLSVRAGEVIGITGPNGAGKTTLLRVAANLLRPVRGRRVGRPRLAYVPAAIEPPQLRAGGWLDCVRRDRRVAPASLLEQLGFDGDLDRPCRELSFGNLRKILLADAFSSRADLVVVDEASEGLDSRGASALVELIAAARSRGAGVVFAEQQTRRIAGADRLVSIDQGGVVESGTDAAEVTVRLRGPGAHLAKLTDAAAALGYRHLVERE